MTATDCFICAKHRSPIGPAVLEGDHHWLVHYPCTSDTPLVYRGHLMVEPKRHVLSFADLKEAEAEELGWLVSKAAALLRDSLQAEHVYAFNLGHLVPHLHMHIVPRYAGTPKEFWGGWKVAEWPAAPKIDSVEVEKLSAKLKAKLF